MRRKNKNGVFDLRKNVKKSFDVKNGQKCQFKSKSFE